MSAVPRSQIAAVRAFNRFYTRRVGALDAGHLGSRFSLTEVRVLYELAYRAETTAGALARDLALDEGYLSRMLTRFRRRGLIERSTSATDARVTLLGLSPKGRKTFGPLDERADDAVRELLDELPAASREDVVAAMVRIRSIVEPSAIAADVKLRAHRDGDLGWIVHRHGVLYSREYGYDARFEAIVASVVSDFLAKHDPKRERCWIADRDGEILGSVMLVKKSPTVAKLRLLYLEPHARGLGLGRKLVDECIAFARQAGYREVTLWTQSSLAAARHIYQTAGFIRTGSRMHADFGPREAAETWDLQLK